MKINSEKKSVVHQQLVSFIIWVNKYMKKILIVEDDNTISNELKELLINSGYKAEVLEDFQNSKEKILESSRRENKNRDLAEMEVTAQAGNIAGRIGAAVCVVLTLIFRIFTKTYFLSPWVVYFSILTTHTLVKYARLKRKTDLILAILYLAMCLTFFAFFILRLVEVKE